MTVRDEAAEILSSKPRTYGEACAAHDACSRMIALMRRGCRRFSHRHMRGVLRQWRDRLVRSWAIPPIRK
jgi:hypothetical protein